MIVYFSKTGNTKFVAEEIVKLTGSEIDEIVEVGEKRDGPVAYMLSGLSSMFKKKSNIQKAGKNPRDYDLIYIGSPMWGWNLVPAVRSYLTNNQITGKKLALFCTSAGKGESRVFSSIKELTKDCDVVGELSVYERELKDKEKAKSKINNWVSQVQSK